MEIDGEVNIEIDQYVPVNLEIDVGTLAEELCQSYNLVDDARMEEYFDSSVEDMVQEEIAGVRLDVSDNADAIDELREKMRGLSPDNNYVRINDLHTTIKEVVDARLIELFTRIIREG